MFKNYFRNPYSISPINLGLARVILASYLIWMIASIEWERLYRYSPTHRIAANEPLWIFVPDIVLAHTNVIVAITLLFLTLFAVGVYMKYTAYISSIFVCYFGILRYRADGTWSTMVFFAATFILVFYALYYPQDKFSLDGVRFYSKEKFQSVDSQVNRRLMNSQFEATPLRLFLLILGLLYFGSGLGKIIAGGTEWVTATNLGRHIFRPINTGYSPELRDIILQYDLLLVTLAVATIAIEIGFLLSIITDKLFDYFVISIIGFHVGIALVMGPIFLYTVVFLLLFVDWERFIILTTPNTPVDVIYSENRHLFAVLMLFKNVDVSNSIRFYSQSDSLKDCKKYRKYDNSGSLYLYCERDIFKGFEAFRQLCRHVRALYPIYFIMCIPPFSQTGQKIYDYMTKG